MTNCLKLTLLAFLCGVSGLFAQVDSNVVVEVLPSYEYIGNLDLRFENGRLGFLDVSSDYGIVEVNGKLDTLEVVEGMAIFTHSISREGSLFFLKAPQSSTTVKLLHLAQVEKGHIRIQNIPLLLSLLPPLLAILLALLFKEVVVSLFIGILSGAFVVGGMRLDSFSYFFKSVFASIDKYIVNALNDAGHLSVIVFSLLIGGMVAIISKNGGMAGVVLSLSRYAKSPKSSQFITWFLGVAIFFDDYANTLIVGNTMRSVTDKFKVSREKLAYLVDSTAAPVAAIAFITTWIGAELGYIDDGISKIDLLGDYTPYSIFLSSLKYSFYPILTLVFMLFLIKQNKDFGPMLKAEQRARTTGQVSPAGSIAEDEPNMEDLSPVEGAPLKWYNAAIPVLVVIGMTMIGLFSTGFDSLYASILDKGQVIDASWTSVWQNMNVLFVNNEASLLTKLGKVIGAGDSYIALLWASFSGVAVAILMTVSSKIMKLFDTMHYMVTGFKTMLPALIILTMAWGLAGTTDALHTADFLSNALQGAIHPYLLPALIFVLAALIAFSTGSSWSTMAILYPIAIPTTFAVCQTAGLDSGHSMEILLNVIATVLAASVLGDHCSPISDTTILSSLASDCNHIDHVRTQLPYALTVGALSLLCVTLSAVFGGGWFLSIALIVASLLILYGIISRFGTSVD